MCLTLCALRTIKTLHWFAIISSEILRIITADISLRNMKLLVISFFLCFAAELSSTSAAIGGGTCFNDEYRLDCGKYNYISIARPKLISHVKLYSIIQFACMIQNSDFAGYYGIQERECIAKGCCWNPRDVRVPYARLLV